MTNAPQSTPQPPGSSQVPPVKPDLTMAWLPHLLMIFTHWLGPLILWLVKKDQDKLAAFHAKQAMLWGIVPSIIAFGSGVLAVAQFGMCLSCFAPLLLMANVAYGIVATVQAYQGKPFKYIVVADSFCAAEFAAAYPDLAAKADQGAQQPPAGT